MNGILKVEQNSKHEIYGKVENKPECSNLVFRLKNVEGEEKVRVIKNEGRRYSL